MVPMQLPQILLKNIKMLPPNSRAKKGAENLLAGNLSEKSNIRKGRKYLDEAFGNKA